ncbi:MAG: hypothetical protein LBK06_02445 [Planctomycetaceae bacterium]|jgi:hypothetical protein|nr:hypothetical protein [Planctomycetaceae bacterium]
MTKTYLFDEKPLAFWMVQMLSDDTEERQTASRAIDAILGIEMEPFDEEVRRIIQNEEVASFGMTSEEYVNRLLVMHIFHTDLQQKYLQSVKDDDNIFIDKWIAEHGNAPEQLKKLMRRICVRNARRERDRPFDSMPGVCIILLMSPLDKEFLPASDLLHWMLQDQQHRGMAAEIVRRMGEAGEPFFDDFLKIARNDSCAVHNYSSLVGKMACSSPEKIERLLKLVDDSNPLLSLFAVASLGSVANAEQLVSGVEERLLRLSDESFSKLYGENAIPINDRKCRNALEKIFACSTMSLGGVAVSEKTLQHFLKLLDTKLPDKPLTGTRSTEPNEYDWEFNVAPFQLVRGTLISSLRYFVSFPEIVVPRLIPLLTEFEEYDYDSRSYERVLDAIAVYAHYDQVETKQESQHYRYGIDESEYLFNNRFESYFVELPAILGNLIWEQPDADDESEQPYLNDMIVEMLGRFGRVSQSQLPLLQKAKTILTKRYGKKYFNYSKEFEEPEPSLIAAIRRIQNDMITE